MQKQSLQAVGERYGQFLLTKIQAIPEIQSSLLELLHEPTGAEIMQIANEDPENLFNLSFRTHPTSSNGVAHILEHTVLCGSKKFPVRDPFFSMKRRSLNTFMNALTGADFTCYPASSQIPKDFYNLLEVYLDAVFHPILSQLSFLQEGHRLEFAHTENPHSPLLIKGIVFNEMKGAMATPDARLSEAVTHALFPNITYGINSGGIPQEILMLTYEELKEFHAQFYHPSRCLFYFYGNLPIEGHLDFLETHAFAGVSKAPPLPKLPLQPRFHQPHHETLFYPISEEDEEKTLFAIAWLTCSILQQEELLALTVLDVVLNGTDAAPLRMALLKSGLCKQAESALEDELSEVPMILICKGCKEDSAPALEGLIRTTLEQVEREGLPSHLVEGAIHQIEMARTEITGHSSPYGLSLFWRAALLKQHGGHPEDGLKIHTLFHLFRQKAEEPLYFSRLIRRYFLDNPHCVRIEMRPDPLLASKERAEEEAWLAARQQTLSELEKQQILKQTQLLATYQKSAKEDHLELLPKVTLDDVQPTEKEFPLEKQPDLPFDLYSHLCFTNELTYVDLLFDLPHLEENELSYMPLFALLLPQVGCGGRNYEQHLEYLLEHTGGVGASLELYLQADNTAMMQPALLLRAKALNRKLDKLFPLLRDMIVSADFTDKDRIKELLIQHLHGLENSIHHRSLRYAVGLAARGFSVASKIANAWSGLDYYWFLKQLVQDFEANPNPVIHKLQEMQQRCLGLAGAHLVLSCDSESLALLQQEGFYSLNEIPKKPFTPWRGDYSLANSLSQARITASPVAFTALLFPSIGYTHRFAAALSIAAEIMENHVLHKRIREQGGAYGCGAANGLSSSHFYFYSFRDPHLKETLQTFQNAIFSLVHGDFDEKEIEEAKLGLFQHLDSPIPPSSRAMTGYSWMRSGRTRERRQAFRQALLVCRRQEIQQAAAEILSPGFEQSVVVCFADKEFLEKENRLLKEKSLPLYSI